MPLKSRLFRNSARVTRAAANNPPFFKGEAGNGVMLLQAALIKLGHPLPVSTSKKGVPDGILGSETEGAIRAFQSKHKLSVDGDAGRQTITLLDELLAKAEKPARRRPPRVVPPPPPGPRPGPPPAPPPGPSPSPPAFTPPSDPDFKVGTDDPPTSPDAGAGAWNSESYEVTTLAAYAAINHPAFLAGAVAFIGDDAVTHLRHYMGNTGRPLNVDVAGMVNEVPSGKTLFETVVALIKAYIEKFPAGAYNMTSKHTWGGYNRQSESKNWYFAVGGYSVWIRGRATVTGAGAGKSYVFEGRYKFYDRYNWDGGKSVTIAGIRITDEQMGEFHREGLAKEYDEVGDCGVRAEWRHGEAIPPGQLRPAGSR